jgi:nucleotide-binding universal stress UspA family protein
MKYKKILLAVDGSEHSQRAAAAAADLATGKDAEILLLTCYNTGVVEDEQPFLDAGQFSKLAAEAKQVLKPYEDMLRARGIVFTPQVQSGIPESAITQVAKEEQCDLIVMGSRGLGKVMGLLLGSVTMTVVQKAPCSVLVVR